MLTNLRHIYEVICTGKTSAFLKAVHIDATNYRIFSSLIRTHFTVSDG